MSAKVLNRRQARWSTSLSKFDFIITYQPGSQQGKSDALSHRSYLAPKEGDEIYNQQKTIVLRPENLNLHSLVTSLPKNCPIIEEIKKNLKEDPLVKNVRTQLEHGEGKNFEFKDELLFYKDLLYAPPGNLRLQILQAHHDFPSARHFGYNKTLESISRDYFLATNVEICKRSY